jgi:protein O-mannosyl-transferase
MKGSKQSVQQKKRAPVKPAVKKTKEQGFITKYRELLLLAVVLVVTLVIYLPALHHRFTNWDDIDYITDNLVIKSLSPANLEIIFTKPLAANYHPLTMLSLALNYKFSGLEPLSYFLVNIILHLFNIVLTYYFAFLLLGRNKPLALFVAAIFAVHPMHVESVAWISERKDVLYAFFYLAGMIAWIRYVTGKGWPWYLFALALFVLSALSKPSSVVFPLILFLLDYLYKRKSGIMLFAEKVPFLAVSAWIGIETIYAQIHSAVAPLDNYSLIQRFLFASYGFFIYIFKLFIPYGLSTLHPFPVLGKSAGLPWVYFIAPVVVLLVIGLVAWSLKYTRFLLFCLLFYFFNIILTLQFMQVGSAVIAERYTYISYIGLLAALAWLVNRASEQRRISLKYVYPVMILFFGAMTVLGSQRVGVWKNSEVLWTDVLEKYPESADAYNSRGYYFLKEKMYDRALPDFNRALEIRPSLLDALNNRGSVYRIQNNPRMAISDYNRALAINPNYSLAISGRGNAYFTLNILDSALADFDRAISINPSLAVAYGNRGAVWFRRGDFNRAIEECTKAIGLDPFYTDGILNRAVAYSSLGKWDQAIGDYTAVLQTITDNPSVYEWRGIAYRSKGAFREAISDFTEGIRLDPRRPTLYVNRAMALQQAGKHREAVDDVIMARQLGSDVTEQAVFAGL